MNRKRFLRTIGAVMVFPITAFSCTRKSPNNENNTEVLKSVLKYQDPILDVLHKQEPYWSYHLAFLPHVPEWKGFCEEELSE